MLTQPLARFAVGRDSVPAAIAHEAKRSVLNAVAAAVSTADAEPVRILVDWARATAAPGSGQVWGRAERFTPSIAALVNATMVHLLDFDDTHPTTILHVSAPVLPAALHPAEEAGLDGATFLSAFAVGAEVALRLGLAVFPAHYDRGYHITATAGAVGAAAAAGRIVGLNEEQMRHALGIAASVGSGLREMFGSDNKSFQVGNAARNGVVAAELALRGLNSAPLPLEGRVGWARATAGGYDEGKLAGLGETWLLAENTYKAYACGVVVQPIIDGVIQARNAHALVPEQVAAIDLVTAPRALDLCGNPRPNTGLEAKFSVYHAAAVSLVDGRAGERQFTDARVKDPVVLALRGKTSAAVNPALAEDQARIAVTLNDGRRLEVFVEHCVGSLEQPMTDKMLEEKFWMQAEGYLSPAAQAEIISLIWDIDRRPDVRQLGLLLREGRIGG